MNASNPSAAHEEPDPARRHGSDAGPSSDAATHHPARPGSAGDADAAPATRDDDDFDGDGDGEETSGASARGGHANAGRGPDPQLVQSAFLEAVDMPTLARVAFLARLRGDDAALADEVESLLGFHRRADAAEDPTAALPGSLLGQTVAGCRIERLIGYGGMSAVYSALQDFPRRRVAIKIVRRERVSASARRRLRVEAEALARLQHPNIARVFAAGSERLGGRVEHHADANERHVGGEPVRTAPTTQDSPYIVMELVEGAVPVTRFSDERRLDAVARIELVARIADAVEHAHRAGVIHRDLKPGNVIVGPDGEPKVIDFGIAAVVDSSVTKATEGPMGTLAYMSPEQARGVAVDTRSDVWGLGALLYDLLAGCPPFDTRDVSLATHLDRLLNDIPAPVGAAARATRDRAFVESIPGAADAVVRKALATDPERRYRSAGEFADELRRLVHGEPLLARPDSDWDGLVRVVQRHRAALTAATGIAVAVVAALVVSLVLLRREREAFARAEWSAYSAAIAAASAMLDRGDASAAAEILRQAPAELRDWEWGHLARRSDQSVWSVDFPKNEQVYDAHFAPDGRTVFAAASSYIAAIDPALGRARWMLKVPGGEPYWRVAPLADGSAVFNRMVSSLERRGADGALIAEASDANALDIAVDRTTRRLFVNGPGGFVERDAGSLAVLREVRADPPLRAFPRAIAVDPDATRVVLGDLSGRLTALDAGSGRVAWSLEMPGPAVEVRGVAVSPDGTLAAGVGGPYIVVADLATGAVVWQTNTSGRVFRAPTFTPDGRELLVATYVESVDRFDARTGQELGRATGIFSQVWTTGAAPDGAGFVAGGLSARVQFFPRDASTEPRATSLDGSPVRSVAPGRGRCADRLFATTEDGGLFAVDRATRGPTRIACDLRAAAVQVDSRGVLVVAHERGLAWLGDDGTIFARAALPAASLRLALLDDDHALALCAGAGTGDRAFVVRRGASDEAHGVWELPPRGVGCGRAAPSAEPGLVYVPSGQGSVPIALRIRDARGAPLPEPQIVELPLQPENPIAAALSPDRRTLAVGSVRAAGEVSLADARSFLERGSMPNHRGGVRALAWAPDGARLATCSSDDTVRVWHVAREVEILVAWRGACLDLAWDDDGTLWLACGDGRVRALDPDDRSPAGR